MAVSHFKELLQRMAKDKNIDWLESVDRVVWEADKKLDKEEITLDQAMEMIRKTFGTKFSRDDYEKIEKETRYRL